MEDRMKIIMKTSIIGIVANLLLAVFKMVVGTVANSISVFMDGVNNLADAGSSLITIIGAAIAGRPADKAHPFGYGRMEYLSSLVISVLILYAGITSLIESVTGILHPEEPGYTKTALIVIVVAIGIKLALSFYTQAQGVKANSDSLVASGKEAKLDVALSVATLAAAIIFLTTGFALEAIIGAVISLVIIKAGVELLMETVSKILGEPEEIQLVIDIKKSIAAIDKVHGAYDLILNDYGPDRYIGSVHVEVDDTMTAGEMDALTREITDKIMDEFQVELTAVGFYSRNTHRDEVKDMEIRVGQMIRGYEHVKGMHGFYADMKRMRMSFDLVVSLDAKDRNQLFESAVDAVRAAYPDFVVTASMDMDFNELKRRD